MASENTNEIWREVLESAKVSVSPAIFSTWFSQTHLTKLQKVNNRYIAHVGCSSSFVKTTVESRYFGLIQDYLIKSLGEKCDLVFTVKQAPNQKSIQKEGEAAPLFKQEKIQEEEIARVLSQARIRPGFTFDNFAVSSSNQMAWAAAEAVSKSPGTAYNPFFMWGGVGVGKTHLMLATGHSLLKRNIDSNILFCTGEEFTNDIVEGIRNKTTQAFRNKYRKLKALLVDDIQFIEGKNAVQEEFFHTFNALIGAGGQIVLVSDRPPGDLAKLEERLRSRFEAGLIVDVAPPDFELRCAITLIKAKERGIEIPMDLIHIIAGNISSARKIEGFIVQLISEAKLKNSEITEDLIQLLLGKSIEENEIKKKASPNEYLSAVCKYFSVGKRALLGEGRARPISNPRQVLMYLLRTELKLPLQEVGRIIGGRDHTTVMHAVEKITHLASKDVQTRQDILGIKNSL